MIVFPDSNLLSTITNPHAKSVTVQAIQQWAKDMQAVGHQFMVPSIAAYEVRRELRRAGLIASLLELETFLQGRYLLLEDSALDRAADLWAHVRNLRPPFPTADPKALDGDVIFAAQVLDCALDPADYIVATTNVKHLSLFVRSDEWQNIKP